jgi:ferredoxin
MIDVVVDESLCTGCGLCVSYCPYGGAEIEDDTVVFVESCTRCTACVAVCPEYALSLQRRPPAAAPGAQRAPARRRPSTRPLP